MKEEHVLAMSHVLLLLAAESQWEVRHASLMGMQHLLAARTVSRVGLVGGASWAVEMTND